MQVGSVGPAFSTSNARKRTMEKEVYTDIHHENKELASGEDCPDDEPSRDDAQPHDGDYQIRSCEGDAVTTPLKQEGGNVMDFPAPASRVASAKAATRPTKEPRPDELW